MPVKLTVKMGAVEISAEAQDPSQCAELLQQATALMAEMPQVAVPAARPVGTATNVAASPGPGASDVMADGVQELLQHAGLTTEDLAKAVSMKDPAKPRILPRLRDSDRVTRQRKGAAVIMALAKRAAQKEDWPVFELTEALKASSIEANELSKGLADGDGRGLFGKTGQAAGTKYHLEVPGEDLAIETLRELVVLAKRPTVAPAPMDPVTDTSSANGGQ